MRRGLERQTLGFEIARVEVLRARAIAAPPEPAAFCQALEGSRLLGWQRRGKYLLASLGFFCLLMWAALNGMFRDLEQPKYNMLENERELDRNV